jgi:ABC-type bacteriocin/lantibiotic exporter with double-glycine peptidase domain
LITRAAAPLGELALAGFAINDVKASMNNYGQLTNVPTLPEATGDNAAVPSHHKFELDHVSHQGLFENVSLEISQGETVVINGISGSGKSTLLGLFLRFDDPNKGSISLGGVDLKDIPYESFIQHIAYVAQDPIIYTGTLADNIRLGNPKANDEEVEQFARYAELNELIDSSEEGIHQSVGQKGSGLSGGERQRVAIARALIKKAPILVLDEATSALDESTEIRVAEHIHHLNATAIIVTHRDLKIWRPTVELTINNQKVNVQKHTAETDRKKMKLKHESDALAMSV